MDKAMSVRLCKVIVIPAITVAGEEERHQDSEGTVQRLGL